LAQYTAKALYQVAAPRQCAATAVTKNGFNYKDIILYDLPAGNQCTGEILGEKDAKGSSLIMPVED